MIYKVKKGDTLSRIAEENKINLTKIKELNPEIKDLNKINIGQEINLPDPPIQDEPIQDEPFIGPLPEPKEENPFLQPFTPEEVEVDIPKEDAAGGTQPLPETPQSTPEVLPATPEVLPEQKPEPPSEDEGSFFPLIPKRKFEGPGHKDERELQAVKAARDIREKSKRMDEYINVIKEGIDRTKESSFNLNIPKDERNSVEIISDVLFHLNRQRTSLEDKSIKSTADDLINIIKPTLNLSVNLSTYVSSTLSGTPLMYVFETIKPKSKLVETDPRKVYKNIYKGMWNEVLVPSKNIAGRILEGPDKDDIIEEGRDLLVESNEWKDKAKEAEKKLTDQTGIKITDEGNNLTMFEFVEDKIKDKSFIGPKENAIVLSENYLDQYRKHVQRVGEEIYGKINIEDYPELSKSGTVDTRLKKNLAITMATMDFLRERQKDFKLSDSPQDIRSAINDPLTVLSSDARLITEFNTLLDDQDSIRFELNKASELSTIINNDINGLLLEEKQLVSPSVQNFYDLHARIDEATDVEKISYTNYYNDNKALIDEVEKLRAKLYLKYQEYNIEVTKIKKMEERLGVRENEAEIQTMLDKLNAAGGPGAGDIYNKMLSDEFLKSVRSFDFGDKGRQRDLVKAIIEMRADQKWIEDNKKTIQEQQIEYNNLIKDAPNLVTAELEKTSQLIDNYFNAMEKSAESMEEFSKIRMADEIKILDEQRRIQEIYLIGDHTNILTAIPDTIQWATRNIRAAYNDGVLNVGKDSLEQVIMPAAMDWYTNFKNNRSKATQLVLTLGATWLEHVQRGTTEIIIPSIAKGIDSMADSLEMVGVSLQSTQLRPEYNRFEQAAYKYIGASQAQMGRWLRANIAAPAQEDHTLMFVAQHGKRITTDEVLSLEEICTRLAVDADGTVNEKQYNKLYNLNLGYLTQQKINTNKVPVGTIITLEKAIQDSETLDVRQRLATNILLSGRSNFKFKTRKKKTRLIDLFPNTADGLTMYSEARTANDFENKGIDENNIPAGTDIVMPGYQNVPDYLGFLPAETRLKFEKESPGIYFASEMLVGAVLDPMTWAYFPIMTSTKRLLTAGGSKIRRALDYGIEKAGNRAVKARIELQKIDHDPKKRYKLSEEIRRNEASARYKQYTLNTIDFATALGKLLWRGTLDKQYMITNEAMADIAASGLKGYVKTHFLSLKGQKNLMGLAKISTKIRGMSILKQISGRRARVALAKIEKELGLASAHNPLRVSQIISEIAEGHVRVKVEKGGSLERIIKDLVDNNIIHKKDYKRTLELNRKKINIVNEGKVLGRGLDINLKKVPDNVEILTFAANRMPQINVYNALRTFAERPADIWNKGYIDSTGKFVDASDIIWEFMYKAGLWPANLKKLLELEYGSADILREVMTRGKEITDFTRGKHKIIETTFNLLSYEEKTLLREMLQDPRTTKIRERKEIMRYVGYKITDLTIGEADAGKTLTAIINKWMPGIDDKMTDHILSLNKHIDQNNVPLGAKIVYGKKRDIKNVDKVVKSYKKILKIINDSKPADMELDSAIRIIYDVFIDDKGNMTPAKDVDAKITQLLAQDKVRLYTVQERILTLVDDIKKLNDLIIESGKLKKEKANLISKIERIKSIDKKKPGKSKREKTLRKHEDRIKDIDETLTSDRLHNIKENIRWIRQAYIDGRITKSADKDANREAARIEKIIDDIAEELKMEKRLLEGERTPEFDAEMNKRINETKESLKTEKDKDQRELLKAELASLEKQLSTGPLSEVITSINIKEEKLTELMELRSVYSAMHHSKKKSLNKMRGLLGKVNEELKLLDKDMRNSIAAFFVNPATGRYANLTTDDLAKSFEKELLKTYSPEAYRKVRIYLDKFTQLTEELRKISQESAALITKANGIELTVIPKDSNLERFAKGIQKGDDKKGDAKTDSDFITDLQGQGFTVAYKDGKVTRVFISEEQFNTTGHWGVARTYYGVTPTLTYNAIKDVNLIDTNLVIDNSILSKSGAKVDKDNTQELGAENILITSFLDHQKGWYLNFLGRNKTGNMLRGELSAIIKKYIKVKKKHKTTMIYKKRAFTDRAKTAAEDPTGKGFQKYDEVRTDYEQVLEYLDIEAFYKSAARLEEMYTHDIEAYNGYKNKLENVMSLEKSKKTLDMEMDWFLMKVADERTGGRPEFFKDEKYNVVRYLLTEPPTNASDKRKMKLKVLEWARTYVNNKKFSIARAVAKKKNIPVWQALRHFIIEMRVQVDTDTSKMSYKEIKILEDKAMSEKLDFVHSHIAETEPLNAKEKQTLEQKSVSVNKIIPRKEIYLKTQDVDADAFERIAKDMTREEDATAFDMLSSIDGTVKYDQPLLINKIINDRIPKKIVALPLGTAITDMALRELLKQGGEFSRQFGVEKTLEEIETRKVDGRSYVTLPSKIADNKLLMRTILSKNREMLQKGFSADEDLNGSVITSKSWTVSDPDVMDKKHSLEVVLAKVQLKLWEVNNKLNGKKTTLSPAEIKQTVEEKNKNIIKEREQLDRLINADIAKPAGQAISSKYESRVKKVREINAKIARDTDIMENKIVDLNEELEEANNNLKRFLDAHNLIPKNRHNNGKIDTTEYQKGTVIITNEVIESIEKIISQGNIIALSEDSYLSKAVIDYMKDSGSYIEGKHYFTVKINPDYGSIRTIDDLKKLFENGTFDKFAQVYLDKGGMDLTYDDMMGLFGAAYDLPKEVYDHIQSLQGSGADIRRRVAYEARGDIEKYQKFSAVLFKILNKNDRARKSFVDDIERVYKKYEVLANLNDTTVSSLVMSTDSARKSKKTDLKGKDDETSGQAQAAVDIIEGQRRETFIEEGPDIPPTKEIKRIEDKGRNDEYIDSNQRDKDGKYVGAEEVDQLGVIMKQLESLDKIDNETAEWILKEVKDIGQSEDNFMEYNSSDPRSVVVQEVMDSWVHSMYSMKRSVGIRDVIPQLNDSGKKRIDTLKKSYNSNKISRSEYLAQINRINNIKKYIEYYKLSKEKNYELLVEEQVKLAGSSWGKTWQNNFTMTREAIRALRDAESKALPDIPKDIDNKLASALNLDHAISLDDYLNEVKNQSEIYTHIYEDIGKDVNKTLNVQSAQAKELQDQHRKLQAPLTDSLRIGFIARGPGGKPLDVTGQLGHWWLQSEKFYSRLKQPRFKGIGYETKYKYIKQTKDKDGNLKEEWVDASGLEFVEYIDNKQRTVSKQKVIQEKDLTEKELGKFKRDSEEEQASIIRKKAMDNVETLIQRIRSKELATINKVANQSGKNRRELLDSFKLDVDQDIGEFYSVIGSGEKRSSKSVIDEYLTLRRKRISERETATRQSGDEQSLEAFRKLKQAYYTDVRGAEIKPNIKSEDFTEVTWDSINFSDDRVEFLLDKQKATQREFIRNEDGELELKPKKGNLEVQSTISVPMSDYRRAIMVDKKGNKKPYNIIVEENFGPVLTSSDKAFEALYKKKEKELKDRGDKIKEEGPEMDKVEEEWKNLKLTRELRNEHKKHQEHLKKIKEAKEALALLKKQERTDMSEAAEITDKQRSILLHLVEVLHGKDVLESVTPLFDTRGKMKKLTDEDVSDITNKIREKKAALRRQKLNLNIQKAAIEGGKDITGNIISGYKKEMAFEQTRALFLHAQKSAERKGNLTDAQQKRLDEGKRLIETPKTVAELKGVIDTYIKEVTASPEKKARLIADLDNDYNLNKRRINDRIKQLNDLQEIAPYWNIMASDKSMSLTPDDVYSLKTNKSLGYITKISKLNDKVKKDKGLVVSEFKAVNSKELLGEIPQIPEGMYQEKFFPRGSYRAPQSFAEPKVDWSTLSMKDLKNPDKVIELLENFLEKTDGLESAPPIIDMTGKLKHIIKDGKLREKLNIIDSNTYKKLTHANGDISASTYKEYKALLDLKKHFLRSNSVYLFSDLSSTDVVSAKRLSESFEAKAMSKTDKEKVKIVRDLLSRKRKLLKTTKIPGFPQHFSEKKSRFKKILHSNKDGIITGKSFSESFFKLGRDVASEVIDQRLRNFIKYTSLSDSPTIKAYDDAVEESRGILFVGDDTNKLDKRTKESLDNAKRLGVTIYIPKDKTRSEKLMFKYLEDHKNKQEIELSDKQAEAIISNKRDDLPEFIFYNNRELSKTRQRIHDAWIDDKDDFATMKKFAGQKEIKAMLRRQITSVAKEFASNSFKFLPEFLDDDIRKVRYLGRQKREVLFVSGGAKKLGAQTKKDLEIAMQTNSTIYIPKNATGVEKEILDYLANGEIEFSEVDSSGFGDRFDKEVKTDFLTHFKGYKNVKRVDINDIKSLPKTIVYDKDHDLGVRKQLIKDYDKVEKERLEEVVEKNYRHTHKKRLREVYAKALNLRSRDDIKKQFKSEMKLALRHYMDERIRNTIRANGTITEKDLANIRRDADEIRGTVRLIEENVLKLETDGTKVEKLKEFLYNKMFAGTLLQIISPDDKTIFSNKAMSSIVDRQMLYHAMRHIIDISEVSHRLVKTGFGKVVAVWVWTILMLSPGWHFWNQMGDSLRALIESKNVLMYGRMQRAGLEVTTKYAGKQLKNVGRATSIWDGEHLNFDVFNVDNGDFIGKKVRESMDFGFGDKDWVETKHGEILTKDDLEHILSSGLAQNTVQPQFAKLKIELRDNNVWFKRMHNRGAVMKADLEMYTTMLEEARRKMLAYDMLFRRGLRIAEADMKVKKWMFDYRDLTIAGRIMRTIFPFYTFHEKSLRLYLSMCLKYGPGVWNAAEALVGGIEKASENNADIYKNRIKVFGNLWLLPSAGIITHFRMVHRPTEMILRTLQNPLHAPFGLGYGPLSGSVLQGMTGQGYFDTKMSRKERFDAGMSLAEIDADDAAEKALKEDMSFKDRYLMPTLQTFLPPLQLVEQLMRIDTAAVTRKESLLNSGAFRAVLRLFGVNLIQEHTVADVDMKKVFEVYFSLNDSGARKVFMQYLIDEDERLPFYMLDYFGSANIAKVYNNKDEKKRIKLMGEIQTTVVLTIHQVLETYNPGDGYAWLEKNEIAKGLYEKYWAVNGDKMREIQYEIKDEETLVYNVMKNITKKFKNAPELKVSRMNVKGIQHPYTKSLDKNKLNDEFFFEDGTQKITNIKTFVEILEKYGITVTKEMLDTVTEEVQGNSDKYKALYHQAKKQKNDFDAEYYNAMNITFSILPDNIEALSDEESAVFWNEFFRLRDELIFADESFKERYLKELSPWERQYHDTMQTYIQKWKGLISRMDSSGEDFNFFDKFYEQPSWFRQWYFLKNPGKALTYPVKRDYYARFDKLMDRGEDSPDFPAKEIGELYEWLWNKKAALDAWDAEKPGFKNFIDKMRQIYSEDVLDQNYFDRFYQKGDDKTWNEFRNYYFSREGAKGEFPHEYKRKTYPYIRTWMNLSKIDEENRNKGIKSDLAAVWFWSAKNKEARDLYDENALIDGINSKVDYQRKWRDSKETLANDPGAIYSFILDNEDWFKKEFFKNNKLAETYYPFARKLQDLDFIDGIKEFFKPENKKYREAWEEHKPGTTGYKNFWLQINKQREDGGTTAYLAYYFKPENEQWRKRHNISTPGVTEVYKTWQAYEAMPDNNWEQGKARKVFLDNNVNLTSHWNKDKTDEEMRIGTLSKEYYDIKYRLPAQGSGAAYYGQYFGIKAELDKFLKDNPELQASWDKAEQTDKQKVTSKLLEEYFNLKLQEDKNKFMVQHPELQEHFSNSLPPGMRDVMELQKRYFMIDEKDYKNKNKFLNTHTDLKEYWEIKALPKSYWTDRELFNKTHIVWMKSNKFFDAARAGEWKKLDMFKNNFPASPDLFTEEGRWLFDKIYREAMSTWQTTFGTTMSTYYFRQLPAWLRLEYFTKHPESKFLSYMSLGRALEEGVRINDNSNPNMSWAYRQQQKYGKNMPKVIQKQVEKIMLKAGKWENRSTWSSAKWDEWWAQRIIRLNRLRAKDIESLPLLRSELKRVMRTYPRGKLQKPLKKYGLFNAFMRAPHLKIDSDKPATETEFIGGLD